MVLRSAMISAMPRDVNSEINSSDPRVLENILNDDNDTTESSKMWLSPYSQTSKQFLYFNFQSKVKLKYMRVWNYNGGLEDSFRGAKKLIITADLTIDMKRR